MTYTAGIRNVVFRDIFLHKPRIAFSIHFDNDKYSRSYYPGAPIPVQERIVFDHVQVLRDGTNAPTCAFLRVATPVDVVTIVNSSLGSKGVEFVSNKAMPDYGRTVLNMIGCTFDHAGKTDLVVNRVPNKSIVLKTTASAELSETFSAAVTPGPGTISVDSDLTGLRK